MTTQDASSLRDAQHTVMELRQFGSGRLHLVVNRVRKKLLHSMHATIDDAMDKAGLPLIGVVPEDDALPVSLNQGTPLCCALTMERPAHTEISQFDCRAVKRRCCGSDKNPRKEIDR